MNELCVQIEPFFLEKDWLFQWPKTFDINLCYRSTLLHFPVGWGTIYELVTKLVRNWISTLWCCILQFLNSPQIPPCTISNKIRWVTLTSSALGTIGLPAGGYRKLIQEKWPPPWTYLLLNLDHGFCDWQHENNSFRG